MYSYTVRSSYFHINFQSLCAVYWLGAHPEIQAIQKEVTTLQRNHPSQIVKQIYKHLKEGPFLRGYKSPNDVENTRAINKLSDHYPQTKLIIGLRHPVRWLESFYNYRVQNGFDMPPLVNMTSPGCMSGMYGVCGKVIGNLIHLVFFIEQIDQSNNFPS
jgi:hypothetical protein